MRIVMNPPTGSAAVVRANTVALNSAASSVVVTFSSSMGTTSYGLLTAITNTVDAKPIDLQVVATAKSATGFTATFNAATDTANYQLEYTAVQNV